MPHISNYLFYVIPIAAGFAFLVSLTVFIQPANERFLSYLSFFLLANWLMEIILGYLALARVNNLFLNNLETMAVVSFYLFLLREIVRRPTAKKVLLYIVVSY